MHEKVKSEKWVDFFFGDDNILSSHNITSKPMTLRSLGRSKLQGT
jgi:hypothetical protein